MCSKVCNIFIEIYTFVDKSCLKETALSHIPIDWKVLPGKGYSQVLRQIRIYRFEETMPLKTYLALFCTNFFSPKQDLSKSNLKHLHLQGRFNLKCKMTIFSLKACFRTPKLDSFSECWAVSCNIFSQTPYHCSEIKSSCRAFSADQ